ncbi:MAG: class I mannose-6-phosphate isomerase [Clostridia bacterium]|nr:class I mannose-6-phosphate isomerase [Clostridia bacterium]
MKKELYPHKLAPICKEAIWGGDKLKKDFSKASSLEKLAETWEISTTGNDSNIIENGIYKGASLSGFLDGKEFPLLVKLIDANDRLSIQVHPDEEYSSRVENKHGKTEMWYIVDAAEDASLVYGLSRKFDRHDFESAAKDGTLDSYLNTVKVKKGDIFFIPSGLVHAIGAGIVIAEIQQPSDVTYRVYDYMRRDKEGNLRPLHLEKALDVIKDFDEKTIQSIRYEDGKDSSLANCRYFRSELISVNKSRMISAKDSHVHLLCIEGEGTVSGYEIKKGDSFLIPCGLESAEIRGNLDIIASYTK